MNTPPIRLLIHGGAGAIKRYKLTAEREQACTQALTASLAAGYAVLAADGSSVDAVIAAIVVMEDSPLFNAGKGSVFSHSGHNEMDASIMDGATRMAG
ncbi:MAG TPA: isoaspartyl peptidase/L-asparaginase, partial [Nitrosomonas halophila]|nr:isoaspartyl peptidase/L-asparaginase [Nitrosomonas halophila]